MIGVFNSDSFLLQFRNTDLTWPEENAAWTISQVPKAETIRLSHSNSTIRDEGTDHKSYCESKNLGNTCWEKSAVQCASSDKPPTQDTDHEAENSASETDGRNITGYSGIMKKKYAACIERLRIVQQRAAIPRKLRRFIGRMRPAFTSNQQHDSRELLTSVTYEPDEQHEARFRSKTMSSYE